MKISVIVCTHNRCNDLMRTLDSLVTQDYPTSDYEVVKDVVDEFIREEIEICLNIEQNGGGIYYSPDVLVHHVIESGKITRKLINKRSYWHGRSFAMIEVQHFGRKMAFRRAGYMFRQIFFS